MFGLHRVCSHVYPTNVSAVSAFEHLPYIFPSSSRFASSYPRYLRSFEWAVSRLPPSHLPENMKLRSGDVDVDVDVCLSVFWVNAFAMGYFC